VVAISASTGEGIERFRTALVVLLPSAEELAAPSEPAGVVVHRFESAGDAAQVAAENGGVRVRGRRIERLAAQTDFGNDESAQRFQRDLARLGIDEQLRRAGVAPGDTVRIGSVELEWSPELWEAR
jgi:GTP-binding protein